MDIQTFYNKIGIISLCQQSRNLFSKYGVGTHNGGNAHHRILPQVETPVQMLIIYKLLAICHTISTCNFNVQSSNQLLWEAN